jgi:DNA-directed RNA polymerase alpha subunit
MSGLNRDIQQFQFDKLVKEAEDFIRYGPRDLEMVEQLLQALRFFKRNRLARAIPLSSKENQVFGKTLLKRRREIFKKQLKMRGELVVTIQFYERLTTRTRNVCGNLYNLETEVGRMRDGAHIALRDLVGLSYDEIMRNRNAGDKVAGEIELALNEVGLYLGMPKNEIEACFGHKS